MTKKKSITYQHTNLEESDHTLNSILDIISEGTWDWDGRTGQVKRSPGWYRMLGYDIGSFDEDVFTWENLIHADDYQSAMHKFEGYIKGKVDFYEAEYRCKTSSGGYIWIIDRGRIIERNEDGSVARMIGVHLNIDMQKKAQFELVEQNNILKLGNITLENIIKLKTQELEKKNKLLEKKIIEAESSSNRDSLTQIANRKKFETDFAKEICRADRYLHSLSLAIFDIDYFKNINDTYGHKVGDKLLCTISQLVAKNIRTVDVFARWGGDEFVIIFPEISFEAAEKACEKLRQLISKQDIVNAETVTCSFGLSQYQAGDSVDELFKRVDKTLFIAKEKGRNQVYASKTGE